MTTCSYSRCHDYFLTFFIKSHLTGLKAIIILMMTPSFPFSLPFHSFFFLPLQRLLFQHSKKLSTISIIFFSSCSTVWNCSDHNDDLDKWSWPLCTGVFWVIALSVHYHCAVIFSPGVVAKTVEMMKRNKGGMTVTWNNGYKF